jgi:hypothetical protein
MTSGGKRKPAKADRVAGAGQRRRGLIPVVWLLGRATTADATLSFDNALAENFFSTLKVELVYRTSFQTRDEAELALFRYVDGWYNPHRIQKALGWRSPDEYEADYHRNLKAATPRRNQVIRPPENRGNLTPTKVGCLDSARDGAGHTRGGHSGRMR